MFCFSPFSQLVHGWGIAGSAQRDLKAASFGWISDVAVVVVIVPR
jgi:hypothetical protein